jgi:hypothetical protein
MTNGCASLTNREVLHRIVDELPEEQTELARLCLEDRAIADISAGRMKTLEQYQRERGL